MSEGRPSKIHNFLWAAVALFHKKRLFRDKEYFRMSQTYKMDPGPPLSSEASPKSDYIAETSVS